MTQTNFVIIVFIPVKKSTAISKYDVMMTT